MKNISRYLRSVLCAFLLLTGSTGASAAVELRTSDDFSAIGAQISSDSAGRSSEDLVVFDIDKTLLLTEDCLDSDATGFARFLSMARQCPTQPTESDTVLTVQSLQKQGFSTMALTARNSSLRDVTLRELAVHQIDLESARGALGVFFSDVRGGKGVVLRSLLSKLNLSPRRIYFVDDDMKNVKALTREFESDSSVDLLIFHYNRY